MATQQYEPFSGKLDAAPQYEEFSGQLDGEPKKPAGIFRKAADAGLAFGQGAAGGTKALTDALGAGNAASRPLDKAIKGMGALMSDDAQQEIAARQKKIKDAEASGSVINEIGANLGGLAEAPVRTIAQGAGSIVPTTVAALLTRGKSLAPLLGIGAAQGAGAVKGSIYDAVEQKQIEAGMSPADAQAAASKAQEYTGPNAGNIAVGGALGAVAGRVGAEGAILGGGARGAFRTGVKAAGEESLTEGAQGGQERYSSNVAEQRQGFDTPTFEGVAGQAVSEGVIGGIVGGGAGAVSGAMQPPAQELPVGGPDGAGVNPDQVSAGPPLAPVQDQPAGLPPIDAGAITRAGQAAPGMGFDPNAITLDTLPTSGELPVIHPSAGPLSAAASLLAGPDGVIQAPLPVLDEKALGAEAAKKGGKGQAAQAQSGEATAGTQTPQRQSPTGQPAGPDIAPQGTNTVLSGAGSVQPLPESQPPFSSSTPSTPEFAPPDSSRPRNAEQDSGLAAPGPGSLASSVAHEGRPSTPQAQPNQDLATQQASQPPAKAPIVPRETSTTKEKVSAPQSPEAVQGSAQRRQEPATQGAAPVDAGGAAGQPAKAPAVEDVAQGAAPGGAPVIDTAAHAAATSPRNDLPEPTDAQKKAGNYPKGHVKLAGMDLSIENPAESARSGKDRDGKAWTNTLKHHYGYIKGTIGNDKDHVDAFVKPDTPLDYAGTVYVVDQVHPDTGRFDEHKVLIGFDNPVQARAAYQANYAKGWKGLKAISALPMAEFKTWVYDGPKNRPLAPVRVESSPLDEKNRKAEQEVQSSPAAPTPEATRREQSLPVQGSSVEKSSPDVTPAPADPAAGKWFGTKEKADEKLKSLGLAETHEVVRNGLKFEFRKKEAQPESTSGNQRQPNVNQTSTGRGPTVIVNKLGPDGLTDAERAAGKKPYNDAPATPQVKTDKAEIRPYRKPDGSIGYEAVPIMDKAEPAPLDKVARGELLSKFDAAPINSTITFKGKSYEKRTGSTWVEPGTNNQPLASSYFVDSGMRDAPTPPPADKPKAVKTPQLPGPFEGTPGVGYALPTFASNGAAKAKPEKVPEVAPAAKQPDPLTEQEKAAKAKMLGAAAKLANLLSKNTRLNITPEQEQAMLPIVIELFEGAMDLGYVKFKQAARYVREFIAGAIDQDAADSIPIDTLQGAYIATARRHKDKDITSKADVIAVESVDELTDELETTPEKADTAPNGDRNGNENTQPGVASGDPRPVPDTQGERGTPAQPGAAPLNPGDVETREPADVGEPAAGDAAGATGVRPASEDVGSPGGTDADGPAGDGRKGAGGKGKSATRARSRSGSRASPAVVDPQTVSPANTGPGDFVIDDPLKIIGGGQVARFDKNKAAIEMRNMLVEAGRAPTREEQTVLAGYTGWGSFGQELFQGNWAKPAPKPAWEARDQWLRENLGQKEWEGLQTSIINAHFTDPPTVLAMWDMVRKMGFTGGRTLEPSIGIGNFYGMMPVDMVARSQRAGIELDPVTGSMAQMLYPNANIQIKGYEESKTPDNFYDLVIGNWPFFEHGPADRRYNRLSPTLHDYFFLKAIDQTRPGGLVVGITSKGTMDKKGIGARMEMARKAELVAAFRLPTGAFAEYAGTAVVTDIIILRKRDKPMGIVAGEGWIETKDHPTREGTAVPVNEYFHTHPDHVIGEIDFGHGTTTFRPGLIVHRPDGMMDHLKRIAGLVPEGAFKANETGKHISYVANHTKDRTNSLVDTPQGLFVVHGEHLAPANEIQKYELKDPKSTAKREAELKAVIGLRQLYGALIDAERGQGQAEDARKALRAAYESFVKTSGPVSKSFGLQYLRRLDDPFYPAIAALEISTTSAGGKVSYRPATILTESTMRGARAITSPTITDAFVLARNETVNPTIARIAEIAGKPESDVRSNLVGAGAGFEMPNGDFAPADVYLSGNVRSKLREARAALESGNESMARNIEALEKVVPEDIPYYKIETQMGATWVPPSTYTDFVGHMLGLTDTSEIEVGFTAGSWKIDFPSQFNHRAEARSGYGSPHVKFKRMVRAAIANQVLNIQERDKDTGAMYDVMVMGDDGQMVKATDIVNGKIADMRLNFGEWLWSDPVRRTALELEYNEVRNAYATPQFDGSFLGFQGMALTLGSGPFNLREHQVNAIWRGLVTRKSLNAHEVGTGKTFTMGGIAVESRRYGIAKKPLLFAHNANSKSVAHEIQMMYPSAKVLYVDNLSTENLKTRMMQIANDDWDVIVMPHSIIDRIGMKEETLMSMAQEELRDLEQAAQEAASDDGVRIESAMWDDEEELKKLRSVTAKQLVKQRLKILTSIRKLAQQGSREDSVAFEDMGVDMLLVDEAHEFKKPPIATKMKLKGLQTATSNRSISMMFLTKYVRSMHDGANVHLFTGTPITNTMTEVFHMMRYMMQEEMKDVSLADWDGWFGSFAREVNDVELTSTGEYEAVTRLQSFINVPELRRMIGQYMDVVFSDDMPEMKPRAVNGKLLSDKTLTEAERAQLLNGRTEGAKDRPYKKVVNESSDMSPEQQRVFAEVQQYANTWKNMSKKDRKDAMTDGAPESPLIHDGIAGKASFDTRLVEAIENAGKEGAAEMEPHPDSKAARTIKNLLEIYRGNEQAAQVVFMSQGMAKRVTRREGPRGMKRDVTHPAFSTMHDMIERLVAAGVPREQIAAVDGGTSKDRRKEVADAMNDGRIRIVFGSTGSLGVGVNMQRNLRAMHHMDAPWMPGDLEQRNGRGHRQGNQWNTVLEYRYITDRLDGKRWQTLARKQKFITDFMKSKGDVRVIDGDVASEDQDDILSTFSEAAGDPRILMREKFKKNLEQLRSRERLHGIARSDAAGAVKSEQRDIAINEKQLADVKESGLVAHMTTLMESQRGDGFTMTVDGKTVTTRADAAAAIFGYVADMRIGDDKVIGTYGDLTLHAEWDKFSPSPNLYVKVSGHNVESNGPSLASLESGLRNLRDTAESTLETRIARGKERMAHAKSVAAEPFHMADKLQKTQQQLDDLERDISMNPVAPPYWLRNGAAIDTEVFRDGKPFTVTGHRWTDSGWYVAATDEKGDVNIPYMEAMDSQGMPLYEEHEFTQPTVTAQNAAASAGATARAASYPPGMYLVTNDKGVTEASPRNLSADDIRQLLSHGWTIAPAQDDDVSFNTKDDAGGLPMFAQAAYTPANGQQQSTADFSPQAAPRIEHLDRAISNYLEKSGPPARPYQARRLRDHAALQGLADAFGATVQGFRVDPSLLGKDREAYGFFNGVYTGGTVYLNEDVQRPHLAVLGHELAHHLAKTEPIRYQQLVRAIRPYVDPAKYRAFARTAVGRNHANNEDKLREEFVGEILSDGFMNRDFWRAVGKSNPNLLQRIVRIVADLLNSALAKMGYTNRSEQYLTDFNKVMQIAGEVMGEYGLKPPTVDFGELSFNRDAGRAASTDADIRFNTKDDAAKTLRSVTDRLMEATSPIGTVSLWDKTVGSQYNKSTKDADFKRVFDGFYQQTDDTAHYAIEAERHAPGVLMRLESLGDVWKGLMQSGSKQKADLAAVSKALFANIEGVEGVKQVEYDDRNLRDLFSLNPRQIEMYRQVRTAVNTSIDRLAQTYAAQFGQQQGMDIGGLKNMSLEDTVDAVKRKIREDHDEAVAKAKLRASVAAEDKGQVSKEQAKAAKDALAAQLLAMAKATDALTKRLDLMQEHATFLRENAYMPALRFGEYAVTVTQEDADGENETLHFEMFESQMAANLAAMRLRKEYPQADISKSILNKQQYEMFKGVSPETVALFAKFTGADQNEAVQNYIALAKSSRSVLMRQLKRKGVAGFSQDATRVLASFVTSNARQAAINMNQGAISDALASKALARKGDVQREAQKLAQYMNNPLEEARRLRGFMFMHFMGGSVASALVNMTQPVMMTSPYLSQFVGAKTAGIMLSSARMAASGKIANAQLRDAAARAAEDGITEPHEIHQLMADAGSSGLGNNLRSRAAIKAWGSFFSLAEAFNSRVTFIAAYQVAQSKNMPNPYEFARIAVIETQGLYGKVNRPNWARGAVGATLFTFKQFSIAWIEFLNRLPRKQKLLALGILVLAAGLQGLPFAEDVEDLIDTIGQSLGYNTNSKKALRKFLIDNLGQDLGSILDSGIFTQTAVDVQGRLGMGNLIPGTSIFKPSETNKEQTMSELVGPLGGILAAAQKALGAAQRGDLVDAGKEMLPVAAKNFAKGLDMLTTGIYKDTRGYKVADVTAAESFMKMLGLQPGTIAEKTRKMSDQWQDKSMVTMMESQIADTWAKGIFDKDPDQVARARKTLAEWNERNPDSRIQIGFPQIRRRVQQMNQTREQRFVKTVPKELRAGVARELAQ